MPEKRILFLWMLLIISTVGLSNDSPQPGYYISMQGDSIRCTIYTGEWNQNPKSVQIAVNGQLKDFAPGQIKGFGVDGDAGYISANVTYHIALIDGGIYPSEYPDSTVTSVCFLRLLVAGRYSLYSLQTSKRIYFIYGRPDGSFTELIDRIKTADAITLEDRSFRQQIYNLFETEEMQKKYGNRINKASYNYADIAYLFSVMDGNHIPLGKNSNMTATIQPEIFFGAIRNSFPTNIYGAFLPPTQADPSTTVSAGFNLLVTVPGTSQSLKFGVGVGYNRYEIKIDKTWSGNFSGSGIQYPATYHETITGEQSMLLSNLYLTWVFNPQSKAQIYIKAGGSFHFALNGDIDISTSYSVDIDGLGNIGNQDKLVQVRSFYSSFIGAAGMTLGKSSFELSYWPPTEIVGRTVNPTTQSSFKIGSFGIFYYYSLK